MKMMERLLPGSITSRRWLYNLTVVAAGVAIFLLSAKLVAALAVLAVADADHWLQSRGRGLGEALMVAMLLVPVAAVMSWLALCIVGVILNLRLRGRGGEGRR